MPKKSANTNKRVWIKHSDVHFISLLIIFGLIVGHVVQYGFMNVYRAKAQYVDSLEQTVTSLNDNMCRVTMHIDESYVDQLKTSDVLQLRLVNFEE